MSKSKYEGHVAWKNLQYRTGSGSDRILDSSIPETEASSKNKRAASCVLASGRYRSRFCNAAVMKL